MEGGGGRGREEGYGVLTYMLINVLYIGTAKKEQRQDWDADMLLY